MRGRPKWHALRIKFPFPICESIDPRVGSAQRIRELASDKQLEPIIDADHSVFICSGRRRNARNTIKEAVATINGNAIGG